MNIQEENILKTVYVLEKGEYDSCEIVGIYSRLSYAEEVEKQLTGYKGTKISSFELETSPNVFVYFYQYKHEDKLSEVTKEVVTAFKLAQFIKNNPCNFRICWRKGYHSSSSEKPREFGHFNAWGFTEQDCKDNMVNGLKECNEYE